MQLLKIVPKKAIAHSGALNPIILTDFLSEIPNATSEQANLLQSFRYYAHVQLYSFHEPPLPSLEPTSLFCLKANDFGIYYAVYLKTIERVLKGISSAGEIITGSSVLALSVQ